MLAALWKIACISLTSGPNLVKFFLIHYWVTRYRILSVCCDHLIHILHELLCNTLVGIDAASENCQLLLALLSVACCCHFLADIKHLVQQAQRQLLSNLVLPVKDGYLWTLES